MSTLDELKKDWKKKDSNAGDSINDESMKKIIRSRVRNQVNVAMRYFWASLGYHIILYSMLTHVFVRYHADPVVVGLSLAGILIFIPFTFVLIRRYKQIALIKLNASSSQAIYENIARRIDLLTQFLRFKRLYEIVLIPLSCLIGVVISFQIIFPGQLGNYIEAMVILYVITLVSCIAAIYRENEKNFMKPIDELRALLMEFDQNK